MPITFDLSCPTTLFYESITTLSTIIECSELALDSLTIVIDLAGHSRHMAIYHTIYQTTYLSLYMYMQITKAWPLKKNLS